MKSWDDDSGLLPLIAGIGIAIAGLFGLSYVVDTSSWLEFLKAIVVASLLFVMGLLALMGKFVTVPRPYALFVGVGLVAGALYLVYRGGF